MKAGLPTSGTRTCLPRSCNRKIQWLLWFGVGEKSPPVTAARPRRNCTAFPRAMGGACASHHTPRLTSVEDQSQTKSIADARGPIVASREIFRYFRPFTPFGRRDRSYLMSARS